MPSAFVTRTSGATAGWAASQIGPDRRRVAQRSSHYKRKRRCASRKWSAPQAALVRLAAIALSPRYSTALTADGFAPIPDVRRLTPRTAGLETKAAVPACALGDFILCLRWCTRHRPVRPSHVVLGFARLTA